MPKQQIRTLADITETSLNDVSGATVAVDAHNWLYKHVKALTRVMDAPDYTTRDGLQELPNVVGVVRGLPVFFRHNIVPVFVFDGSPHDQKADELERREARREHHREKEEEARERGDSDAIRRHKSHNQTLTDEMITTTQQVLTRLNVPWLVAPESGEAQAAYMSQQGDVAYAVSDDYDSLLFGADETVRNVTGNRAVELLHRDRTLAEHGITQEQLVDIALLCGTDYNDGVYNVGPKRGLKTIKEHGDIFTALDEMGENIDSVEELRNIFLNPSVTGSYTIPKTLIDPDVERTREFVVGELGLSPDVVTGGFNSLKRSI